MELKGLFADWDHGDTPGCAAAALRGGEVLESGCFGMADLEAGTPIAAESLFYVASVSKQFTAACVLLLAQEGALGLDDGVRRWFPELPEVAAAVTVGQLIHHTSGLRDVLDLWAAAGRGFDAAFANADTLRLICRQQGLNFQPGTGHLYCNSGYALLAELVPRASGLSLRAFADQRFFAPLGMGSTRFDDDNAELAGRVRSYRPAAGGGWHEVPKAFTIVGSGGLLTTVDDLRRWDRNFDTGQVGGTGLLEAMVTPGRLADGTSTGYAGGLQVGTHKGLRTVEHAGGMLGFRAHLLRFPDQGLTVICLGNAASFDARARALAVADRHLGGDYLLAAYAGPWICDELEGTVYELERAGPDLVLRRPERLAGPLRATAADTFRLEGSDTGRLELTFRRDSSGAVEAFVLDAGRAQGLLFRRA